MKSSKWRLYAMAVRASATFLLMTMLAVFAGGQATAQENEYFLSVDLPLQFVFTGNISGSATPSGFKAMLQTPWIVVVGLESYTVEAQDAVAGINTELEIQIIDVGIHFDMGPMLIGLAYGVGGVSMLPFNFSGVTFSAEEADATQISISLGWRLSPTWDFHVGYHALDAETTLQVNGVATPSKLDLGGIMHSAGFSYWF